MMRRSALGLACSLAMVNLCAAPARAQDSQASNAPPASEATDASDKPPADDPRIMASAKVLQRSLDAWRSRNFERWLACFAPDVVVIAPQMHIKGRKELRAIYQVVFEIDLPDPVVLDSGWTGERIFVYLREYLVKDGPAIDSYAEYEVKDGQITAVYSQII